MGVPQGVGDGFSTLREVVLSEMREIGGRYLTTANRQRHGIAAFGSFLALHTRGQLDLLTLEGMRAFAGHAVRAACA